MDTAVGQGDGRHDCSVGRRSRCDRKGLQQRLNEVLGCPSLSREAPSASCVMGAWQAWRRLPVGMVVTRPQFKDLQLINVAGSASWLVLIFGLFAFGGMAGSLIDWIDWDMPAHQQGTGSASQLLLCPNLRLNNGDLNLMQCNMPRYECSGRII